MPQYFITKTIYETYQVSADSEDEAKERYRRGEGSLTERDDGGWHIDENATRYDDDDDE